jgi:hypothetical protein
VGLFKVLVREVWVITVAREVHDVEACPGIYEILEFLSFYYCSLYWFQLSFHSVHVHNGCEPDSWRANYTRGSLLSMFEVLHIFFDVPAISRSILFLLLQLLKAKILATWL